MLGRILYRQFIREFIHKVIQSTFCLVIQDIPSQNQAKSKCISPSAVFESFNALIQKPLASPGAATQETGTFAVFGELLQPATSLKEVLQEQSNFLRQLSPRSTYKYIEWFGSITAVNRFHTPLSHFYGAEFSRCRVWADL